MKHNNIRSVIRNLIEEKFNNSYQMTRSMGSPFQGYLEVFSDPTYREIRDILSSTDDGIRLGFIDNTLYAWDGGCLHANLEDEMNITFTAKLWYPAPKTRDVCIYRHSKEGDDVSSLSTEESLEIISAVKRAIPDTKYIVAFTSDRNKVDNNSVFYTQSDFGVAEYWWHEKLGFNPRYKNEFKSK